MDFAQAPFDDSSKVQESQIYKMQNAPKKSYPMNGFPPQPIFTIKTKSKGLHAISPLHSKLTVLVSAVVISHGRSQRHKCVSPLILPLFSLYLVADLCTQILRT